MGSIRIFSEGLCLVGVWGYDYVRGSFHGGSFNGKRNISMKGVQDFPTLFKITIRNNKNKFFSAENEDQD